MSDSKPSDISISEIEAKLQRIKALTTVRDLISDAQTVRAVRDAYLTRTEAGNRAVIGLIGGFEGEPCEILRRVFVPWLFDQYIFEPAQRAGNPAIRAAAELLRNEFREAHNSERAALRLVKG
jgi:hypothetical protein